MLNGAWHEPDYSQSSGFNVIDFPLHYNFGNAAPHTVWLSLVTRNIMTLPLMWYM